MNPDSKISLQSLAVKLGLAKSTVSMGLRGDPRVAAGTRHRILIAAKEHGYSADADVSAIMARIQARSPAPYQSNLALIPITETRVGKVEMSGCERRAEALGYKLDVIRNWHTFGNPVKLLEARGIQGVIFVGWPWAEFSPRSTKQLQICSHFPSAVIASKPVVPAINCVISDSLNCMHQALHEVIRLGYRRPAAFLNRYLDDGLDHAYTGAFLAAQRILPNADRLPPEYIIDDPKRSLPWIAKHKPDCVLTHDHFLLKLLRDQRIKIPGQMGFVHLDLAAEFLENGVSGINQNHDLIGEVAVDMVVAQIHRSERGIPPIRKCVSISGQWIGGNTTRRIKNLKPQTGKN